MRSRIRQSKDSLAKRNILLSIGGLLLIFVLIIIFGIPFLINLSLFVEKKIDNSTTGKSDAAAYIAPPQLDISYTATNSGVITVGGTGQEDQTISLYVNNERVDEQELTDDLSFAFDGIRLQEGTNEIFAKAKVAKKSSNESEHFSINYIKDAPEISVDSPADGQGFNGGDNRTISVSGKTREGAKVTVNGFWSVMQPDGSFSYRLGLQDGENQIRIVAEDEATNRTEKSLKVTFSP